MKNILAMAVVIGVASLFIKPFYKNRKKKQGDKIIAKMTENSLMLCSENKSLNNVGMFFFFGYLHSSFIRDECKVFAPAMLESGLYNAMEKSNYNVKAEFLEKLNYIKNLNVPVKKLSVKEGIINGLKHDYELTEKLDCTKFLISMMKEAVPEIDTHEAARLAAHFIDDYVIPTADEAAGFEIKIREGIFF